MKYCSKCGNTNADEAVFCSSCGTPLEQAPEAPQPQAEPAQPAAPTYTAPTYTAPAYESPAYTAPAAVTEQKNPATLWLILNIVAAVLCCPGFVFSVIGIILAGMGMSSFKKGDVEDAKKKSKTSMIMFIIGIVVGLFTIIAGIVVWVIAANS